MSTTTDTAVISPNPIFAHLIDAEPEESWVRRRFGLGHLDELALDPDEVHDPEPVRLITQARLVSSTPTGSLMLDMGPARTVDLTPAGGGR